MHDAELETHQLTAFAEEIQRVSRPCSVGSASAETTGSYFGGMPWVPSDFDWPTKDGYPLSFVGQLRCCDLGLVPSNDGHLLFFYDRRHWGNKPSDIGHAIVVHVPEEADCSEPPLPALTVPAFFGLRTKVIQPQRFRRTNVRFADSVSYPRYERERLSFTGDVAQECYAEFCDAIQPDVQIDGYPSPIQSDFMESDCIRAFGIGDVDDWRLLLQLFEIGDMTWGDAGALYWFIHQDDLKAMRFDRVWMVHQCH